MEENNFFFFLTFCSSFHLLPLSLSYFVPEDFSLSLSLSLEVLSLAFFLYFFFLSPLKENKLCATSGDEVSHSTLVKQQKFFSSLSLSLFLFQEERYNREKERYNREREREKERYNRERKKTGSGFVTSFFLSTIRERTFTSHSLHNRMTLPFPFLSLSLPLSLRHFSLSLSSSGTGSEGQGRENERKMKERKKEEKRRNLSRRHSKA